MSGSSHEVARGLCWKINTSPPLFTVLQLRTPTYGVRIGWGDQPLSLGHSFILPWSGILGDHAFFNGRGVDWRRSFAQVPSLQRHCVSMRWCSPWFLWGMLYTRRICNFFLKVCNTLWWAFLCTAIYNGYATKCVKSRRSNGRVRATTKMLHTVGKCW